jgi:O-antigen/teichoic acid export membrane protein
MALLIGLLVLARVTNLWFPLIQARTMHVFRHPLFHAFKWSAAGELASRLIQPLVFLILARLLTPEDFGVIAAATMVISFSQVFWEAGMGKALIQRREDVREASDVAFWINIALGILVAGLIFLAAEPVASHIFKDERVNLVLQVMVLQVILASLVSVHTALLQKEFRFQELFWVRLLTVALPAFASIPLAMYGWSYWALVAGTLIGQAIQTLMLWRVHEWRPSWAFDLRVAREMAGFGAWVGLSGLLGWFYVWADALVVGMYLGAHELGLYRTGGQISMLVFGMIFSPLLPVLYSQFSATRKNRIQSIEEMLRTAHLMALFAFPLAAIIFLARNEIGLLFGVRWDGLGFVIGMFAIKDGLLWSISVNNEMYRALGRPHIETWASAIMLIPFMFVYMVAVQYGFAEFIVARLILGVLAFAIHIAIAHVIMKIDTSKLIRVFAIPSIIVVSLLLTHNVTIDRLGALGALALCSLVFVPITIFVAYSILEKINALLKLVQFLYG